MRALGSIKNLFGNRAAPLPVDRGPLAKLNASAKELRVLATKLPSGELYSALGTALDNLCRSIETLDGPIVADSHQHQRILSEAAVLKAACDDLMPLLHGSENQRPYKTIFAIHQETFKAFTELGGIVPVAQTPGQVIAGKIADNIALGRLFPESAGDVKALALQLPGTAAEFKAACVALHAKIDSVNELNASLKPGLHGLVTEIETIEQTSFPAYLAAREAAAVQAPMRMGPRTPVDIFCSRLVETFGKDAAQLIDLFSRLPAKTDDFNDECIRLSTIFDPRSPLHPGADSLLNEVWRHVNGTEMGSAQARELARLHNMRS